MGRIGFGRGGSVGGRRLPEKEERGSGDFGWCPSGGGVVDGETHRAKGECQRRRDVSDRIGGGVGELDNHQNSRQYLRESRERSAPVTTADCLHEVSQR